MPSTSRNIFQALSKIRNNEFGSTAISFALALVLMSTYYILRPVRDAMASDWTDAELSALWTFNFFFSFVIVWAYGFFAARISLKKLVPGVYLFFAFSFSLFYIFQWLVPNFALVDKVFYAWVTAFSLLQFSIFWSFMSSIFSSEQSKRLFGIITSGASIGAIIGPSISLFFSTLGTYQLLLIASAILLLTWPLISYLNHHLARSTETTVLNDHRRVLGGNSIDGFKALFSSPLLMMVALFLFLYTGISSFVYFEIKNMMVDFSREQRTEVWAVIDLATNSLTIVTGLFLTSRIATKFGIGITLALIPVAVMVGMLSLVFVPVLALVVGLQIVRRSGNYAITKPVREMVFTYVDIDTRFKAKQVIDVVVYRGGDVFWAWGFTLLTGIAGLGIAGVAVVGAAIAALWGVIGLIIGRKVGSEQDEEPALVENQ